MKANEVRVGNYLKVSKNYIIVDYKDIEYLQTLDKTYFEPIPLTEEWLIKFGFKLVDNVYTLKGFNVIVFDKTDIRFIGVIDGKILKYVHQLQNLYFVLTGEELKQIEKL